MEVYQKFELMKWLRVFLIIALFLFLVGIPFLFSWYSMSIMLAGIIICLIYFIYSEKDEDYKESNIRVAILIFILFAIIIGAVAHKNEVLYFLALRLFFNIFLGAGFLIFISKFVKATTE